MKTILKPFFYIFMCLVIFAVYATKALEDCVKLFKQQFRKMKLLETSITIFFISILTLICIGSYQNYREIANSQQYRITVFNADGSINEIYETNRYWSAEPSISFVDQHKGKIEIFNCPTIIKSQPEPQVPLPPKLPPQDRTAEEEGRKAEKAGKELKDNPYEKGTRKHSQWEAGWWTSHDSFFGVS